MSSNSVMFPVLLPPLALVAPALEGTPEGARMGRTGAAPAPGSATFAAALRRTADGDLHRAARHVAQLGPPAVVGPGVGAAGPPLALPDAAPTVAPAPASAPAPPPPSLEELLPALVRRVAWSGDARRGAVRLELGAGPLEGATLLVRAEGSRVEVTLRAPPGVDADAWTDHLTRRLEARGIDVHLL
jgi:hypothetical protein